MSDARDERSEVLDEEKLSEEYPPERPLAVDDYGVTAGEQGTPEPLEEFVEREVPEVAPRDVAEEPGTVVEPSLGEAAGGEALAEEAGANRDGPDDTMSDVAQERAVEPAEEAAMRLTEAPPVHESDGYLED